MMNQYLNKFLLFCLCGSMIVVSACKKAATNIPIAGDWELISVHSINADSTVFPPAITTYDSVYTPGDAVTQFKTDSTYITTDHSVTPNVVDQTGTYKIIGSDSIALTITSSLNISVPPVGVADTASYSIVGTTLTTHLFVSQVGQYATAITTVYRRQ
jgi:hypothetical protein